MHPIVVMGENGTDNTSTTFGKLFLNILSILMGIISM